MATPAHHSIATEFERNLDTFDPDGTLRTVNVAVSARTAAAAVIGWADLWDEHIGPFYTADYVRTLLAVGDRPVSRQAVAQRTNLLALTTGSGRVVYPAFQFRTSSIPEGLGTVLEILDEELVSRWTVASWLVTPNKEFDDEAPLELLEAGMVEPVVTAALRWASNLAA
jgi:hypothetical protein